MTSRSVNLRTMSARTADARASAMVQFCLDRARECRRFAETAASASQKRSWLEMEGRWFFLARSYDSQRRANRRDEVGEPAKRSGRPRKGVVVPLVLRVRAEARDAG